MFNSEPTDYNNLIQNLATESQVRMSITSKPASSNTSLFKKLRMNTANDTVIDWYRTPLGPGILEALNNKSNLKGLLQAGGHLCLIITTGTLSVYVYYNHSWILLLPIIFLHGTIAAFLSNACHEFVHGTVFSSRILNKFFFCFP